MSNRSKAVFLILTLFLPACSPSEKQEGGSVSIKAMVDASSFHKKWKEDDAIAVFAATEGYGTRFTLKDYGERIATFEGSVSSDASVIHAAYPFGRGVYFNGENIEFEFETLQEVEAGTPSPDCLFSCAVSSLSGTLAFKANYACLGICLKGSDEIESARLCVDGWDTVTIQPLGQEIFGDGMYYFTFAPASMPHGFRLLLENAKGKEAACDYNGALNFIGGTVITFDTDFTDGVIWVDGGVQIDGTPIDPTMMLYGQVRDYNTGKGIAGVPVSDGYGFAVTDENGVYQMNPNPLARRVFITVPSGYEVPLDSSNFPAFFSQDNLAVKERQRIDFTLHPAEWDQKDFTLLVIGDPQCRSASDLSRFKTETLKDIVETLNSNQSNGRYQHAYAIQVGDIGYDSNNVMPSMKDAVSNIALDGGYLPMFQCMGNHDHDGSDADATPYSSDACFDSIFGPKDYSVNIGNVHIVVMDNVRVSKRSSNTSPNGGTWDSYGLGLTDEQMEWLRQDLSLVRNKAEKTLIFCAHIPYRSHAEDGLFGMFKDFGSVHLMTGHTHYPHNYIHTKYTCAGGLPIYEHVHGAACGTFWHSNLGCDGSPNGYSIYTIRNGRIENWIAKAVGYDEGYQMRVYDGNQTWNGSKGTYNWFTTSSFGSLKAKGDARLKNAFVATIWNDDVENWDVEFWQNGEKKSSMKRLNPGDCCDMCTSSFNINVLGYNSKYYNDATAGHFWYYVPESLDPSSEQGWEIVARQTIPGSVMTNVYRCSKLTTDYTGFKK